MNIKTATIDSAKKQNHGDYKTQYKSSFGYVNRNYISLINHLYQQEYREESPQIFSLINDIYDLYLGNWESHEACQVGYHTLQHVLEVMLAACKMIIGWNHTHDKDEQLNKEQFIITIASAIFHDSGYIKDKNDHEGTGGKHAFIHVSRSSENAKNYLQKQQWEKASINLVCNIIDTTEFNQPVNLTGELTQFPGKQLACIVGTADLLAQMADVHYMENLPALFAEFQEAYDFEDIDELKNRGVRIFESVQEMINETPMFFEKFVVPRLESLGRMDRYLNEFFNDGRNSYMESISTNLYRLNFSEHYKSQQKIGELMHESGFISSEALNEALAQQPSTQIAKKTSVTFDFFVDELVHCIDTSSDEACLGGCLKIEFVKFTPQHIAFYYLIIHCILWLIFKSLHSRTAS